MELKRCPFCGRRARVESSGNHYVVEKFKVRCVGCLVVSAYYDSREEAIAAWNRRYVKCESPRIDEQLTCW